MAKKTVTFQLNDDDLKSLRYIASRLASDNLSQAERIVIRLSRALFDDDVMLKDILKSDILKITRLGDSPFGKVMARTAMKRPEKLAELYKNE